MKRVRLILLAPFGIIFGVIGLIRRRLYQKKLLSSYAPTVPTICIGNVAVGGSGKTPMVEYLVRMLQKNGRVATLSRGYKRSTTGFLCSRNTSVGVTASTFGDEPTQLHQKFPDIDVAVCEKRAIGVQQLQRLTPAPDIVLLDDAYQHLPIRCAVNILLTDYARPYYSDFPLPAGNLREFPCAAKAAHIVVVTKCPTTLPEEEAANIRHRLKLTEQQHCFFSTLIYDVPQPVTEAAFLLSLSTSTPIVLLTAIANPQPLESYLSTQFDDIQPVCYQDHHHFTMKEVESLCQKVAQCGVGAAVMTTEKDWTRLQDESFQGMLAAVPVFVLPIQIQFLFQQRDSFQQLLLQLLKK